MKSSASMRPDSSSYTHYYTTCMHMHLRVSFLPRSVISSRSIVRDVDIPSLMPRPVFTLFPVPPDFCSLPLSFLPSRLSYPTLLSLCVPCVQRLCRGGRAKEGWKEGQRKCKSDASLKKRRITCCTHTKRMCVEKNRKQLQ